MNNKELVLNMLAELSTEEISESKNSETFKEHMDVAESGGEIDRNARIELEAKTGKAVISPLNAKTGMFINPPQEDEEKNSNIKHLLIFEDNITYRMDCSRCLQRWFNKHR